MDKLNPVRHWTDLNLTAVFIMFSPPLVHPEFGIFLKRPQLKSWRDYKSSPLWQFLNYTFFFFALQEEQLALPSSSFLSSFLLPYSLKLKYSVRISGEIDRVFGSVPCLSNLIGSLQLAPSNSWLLWDPWTPLSPTLWYCQKLCWFLSY